MRAGSYAAPATHPHESTSRCARSCCWTPLGHSSAAKACRCHQGADMASRTPAATLRAVKHRDGGARCTLTAAEGDRIVPQHRQGGMGGRPDKHRPENVIGLDSILNGLIESSDEWQSAAKVRGVKVPIWVRDITRVPVFYQREQQWFILRGELRIQVTAIEALDMMLDVYGDEYLQWAATAEATLRALPRRGA